MRVEMGMVKAMLRGLTERRQIPNLRNEPALFAGRGA
jgi:hypothetical protein